MSGIQMSLLGASGNPLQVTGDTAASGADFISGPGTVTVNTNTISVSASGGTPPYSYLWQYVSGDTFSPSATTSASTYFQKNMTVTFAGDYQVANGVQRCRVTDSASSVVYGPNVAVQTSLSETS